MSEYLEPEIKKFTYDLFMKLVSRSEAYAKKGPIVNYGVLYLSLIDGIARVMEELKRLAKDLERVHSEEEGKPITPSLTSMIDKYIHVGDFEDLLRIIKE